MQEGIKSEELGTRTNYARMSEWMLREASISAGLFDSRKGPQISIYIESVSSSTWPNFDVF